jgi:hypothetical protein
MPRRGPDVQRLVLEAMEPERESRGSTREAAMNILAPPKESQL